MDNRRSLIVQVRDSLHYGSHNVHRLRQSKALIRLFLSHRLQVRPLNIIHEHIGPVICAILKHIIDTGQGTMVYTLENLAFKSEASAFLLARINHFLKSKEVAFDALISYQVNSAKTTLAEQTFDNVAIP